MLEHWITHLPFRSWCSHCVAGKCKNKPHMVAGKTDEESDVPIIAFDYAFMSDKETEKEDEADEDISDLTILVGRDKKSKTPCAISVPCKGVDQNEYAVKRVLKFLDFLGYEKVLLKSDQESSMKAVLSSVRAHRGAECKVWETFRL